MDKSLYYNPNKMLSFNRILNFVIGARGIGKSYSMKRYVINRFLKTGAQFVFLRRYKSELRKIKNYFDDIANEFPDTKFEVKGREFYIDGQLAGWAIPLSSWQTEKSNAYPNVETIIFDEFIREKDKSGYLPNDVEALLNLMDTVFRNRNNTRCICLSNAVSIVNPYFLYFGITPDVSKRFNSYASLVVEVPESIDFSEQRRQTRFGSLISGTNYGDMSLDNEFTNDSDVFIERRTKESRFQYAIVHKGMVMGLWYDIDEQLLFMSQNYDPSSKNIYVLAKDDMVEGRKLVTSYRSNYDLIRLVRVFQKGNLRFENQVMRTTGYDMFNKLGVQ